MKTAISPSRDDLEAGRPARKEIVLRAMTEFPKNRACGCSMKTELVAEARFGPH